MKIAIMQPYFLPYIGYFQLIAAVDKFIVYDDVNYIKSGWINRNKILIDKKASIFTLPLTNSSSFSKINDIKVNHNLFLLWKNKFLKSIIQSYKKAPQYDKVFNLIECLLIIEENVTISFLATKAIKEIANYLNIKTEIVESSACYNNSHLKSYDRVLDICLQENATQYINPIGGSILYDKAIFKQKAIQLNFLQSKNSVYKQFNHDFVPWLSIIDVLMFNSVDDFKYILNNYDLV